MLSAQWMLAIIIICKIPNLKLPDTSGKSVLYHSADRFSVGTNT